jgi:hypothetical protein
MKSYLNSNIKNQCFLVFLSIVFGGFLCHSKPSFADVNPDGSFSYSIPIKTPPGTNGVAPQLSLDYNSNAGNGMLGMGFSLSGLSEITRMNWGKGINYNGQDTYIGPDGRLVDINGNKSEYHTEHESWAKHVPEGTCGDGPCSWTVYEKTGNKFYFGTSEDSRIEAVGKKGGVRVWALHKFEDRFGNFYEVEYFEDTEGGDYYPKRITYTKGNGLSTFHTVEFGYGEKSGIDEPMIQRHDHWKKYIHGAKVEMDSLLRWITIKSDSNLARKYKLTYDIENAISQSRLVSFQEDRNGGNVDISSWKFDWEENNSSGFKSPELWLGKKQSPSGQTYHPNPGYQYTGDFNGDGKTDYMFNWHGWYVAISTGDGFEEPKLWLGNKQSPSGQTYHPNPGYQYTGDFNGDGKTDYMFNWHGWYVAISTGDGFEEPKLWLGNKQSSGGQTYHPNQGYRYTGDFNGDGKTDYMFHWYGWYVAISTGDGFEDPKLWLGNKQSPSGQTYNTNPSYQYIGDFNKDGKTDYMFNWHGWYVAISTGDGFEYPKLWLGNKQSPSGRTYHSDPGYQYIGDFNGDGKTDYMFNWHGWYVAISTGDGFEYPKLWLGNKQSSNGQTFHTNPGYQYTGDFNGDGKTDYMFLWGGWHVAISMGDGFEGPKLWLGDKQSSGVPTYNNNPGYQYIGDFNGDGKLDYLFNYNGWYIAMGANELSASPEILTTISNNQSATIVIEKKAAPQLLNAIVPNLVGPGISNNSRRQLVTRVSTSNGRGQKISTRYEYYNGRIYPGTIQERADLGFEWVKKIDEQTGAFEITYYRQDKPFHRRHKKSESYAGTRDLLSKTKVRNSADLLMSGTEYEYKIRKPYPGVKMLPTKRSQKPMKWENWLIRKPRTT